MIDLRQSRKDKLSWRSIFTRNRKLLKQVFELLAPHTKAIAGAWQRQFRHLEVKPGARRLFGGVDLWSAAVLIPTLPYSEFDKRLRQLGSSLGERQVPLMNIVETTQRVSEITLSYIPRAPSALLIPVVELMSVIQACLVIAYSHHRERQFRLVQTRLREFEKRQSGVSSYVTGVYEQERRLLSHDLHDDIGHDLVLMKMYLDMLAGDLQQRKFESSQARVNEARLLVGHTLDSVRRLVLDLGPAIFDELGFVSALKFYARRFSTSTGIEVTVSAGNFLEKIPQTHQVTLYRVLQGALSNVLKHSKAKQVNVAVGVTRDGILFMTIEDDGIGMDTRARQPVHRFGLRAMRERVELLDGKVHIESWRAAKPGQHQGTRVEVSLPLQKGSAPWARKSES